MGISEHRGKGNEKSRSKSKSKGFDKLKYRCLIFHRSSYLKKDCPERGGGGGGGGIY